MEKDVSLSKLAELPALDPILGTLPGSPIPYRLTMSDIHQLFVVSAPFRERREDLFAAFEVYSKSVWEELPKARLWVDGGFSTHKNWEAPDDIDVLVVDDDASLASKARLASRGMFTMSKVTGTIGKKELPELEKLRPFGGMIDAYYATSFSTELIRSQWTQVRGPDGEFVPGAVKGIVEVVRGVA